MPLLLLDAAAFAPRLLLLAFLLCENRLERFSDYAVFLHRENRRERSGLPAF